MQTFRAQIKPESTTVIEVEIRAKSIAEAKQLLEAQYGKGKVFTGPHPK